MRVLVVEDEAALRSFLVPRLRREGWEVEAADSGALALAAVQARRPDLVLLDVGLPDLSGLEVCRELRRLPGYLPVLMLTGLDSRDDELRGFAAQVWKPDAAIDTHAVTARVSALRSKVEPKPNRPRYLLTRPGVGYYLQLPESRSSETTAKDSASGSDTRPQALPSAAQTSR